LNKAVFDICCSVGSRRSKQLVQRTKMLIGQISIASEVVRIDHCCRTEVVILTVAVWVTMSLR